MSYIGTSKIGKMFLGGTEIAKAYLGSNLVYQNKPYDAEVEYLESTGTQYIDTGAILNSESDIIDIDFMITQGSSNTKGVFGCRLNASSNNISILKSSSNSIVVDVNNGNYSTYRINSLQDAINTRCNIHIERGYKYIMYNGVLMASSNTMSQIFSTNAPAFVFAVVNVTAKSCLRLYTLQLSRNNIAFIDLIPVRCGTTGYMYDRVSGQLFGNAGTGDFIVGPDKS